VRQNPYFNDPIFRQFFGRGLDGPRERVETSLGSGVIMSDRGFILTNNHVIQGADAIQVCLRDGRTAEAQVVGVDPDTDLAVLRITLDKLPSITLGNADRVRVGDVALAIGNPFGVGQTVTMGIVSATGRNKVGINTFENFIQTDAAINPGNSGGALVDAQGNLIGINTAILSRTGGYQGIGWAIPMSIAKGVMQDIVQHGRALRGWLGFGAEAVTPEFVSRFNLKSKDGLLVTGIYRDGPADKAGLQPGDVITQIDGKDVDGKQEALIAISNHRPGAKVALTVVRGDKTLTLHATAIERPQRGPPG
jgi:Do/DeqQ family serine protease